MSRLVEVAGFDPLRMVSNRNIKISANIVTLPWFDRSPGLVDNRLSFPLHPAI
jgi:hypothetical protein